MAFQWQHGFPDRRPPRKAKGGIKATTKRGAFGQQWWSRRWLEALERFTPHGRLARGRTYARKGQVLALELSPGAVAARVQGSQARPYRVELQVERLADEAWDVIARELVARTGVVARLLAGDFTDEARAVIEETGLALFPARRADVTTSCSCPDASNPCKHVAAVFCLLGEEFDRDPFRLLELRGLTRDRLLARLGAPAIVEEAPEPLDARGFHGGAVPELQLGTIEPPPIPAPLARTLGPFPLWRGERPLLELLEPVYREAARRAVERLA